MKSSSLRLFVLILGLVVGIFTVAPALGQGDPVDQLEVLSVQNTELTAGPARTSAFLAPSGEKFAHLISDSLCVYAAPSGTPLRCITLSEDLLGRIDNENVRWSPDERYLALGQEALITFRDSDLLVFDTETGDLMNITDDDYAGAIIMRPLETTIWIDLSPRWTPDGDILFLRTIQTGTDLSPTSLYRIAPDGTGLEEVATLPGERFRVYWFNISPDGTTLVYSEDDLSFEDPDWITLSDLDGSHARPLARAEFPLINATFSPDGEYLLTLDAQLGLYSLDVGDPAKSPIRVIEVATGEVMLVDDTQLVYLAGWAPSGHGLAYLTRANPDEGTAGLFLSAEPGEPGHLVLEGRFYPPTSRQQPPIPWGSNNVILLSSIEGTKLRIIELGTP